MGHGGGTHEKAPAMAGRAHRLVTGGGFAVAVIDAPGHGDRPPTLHDEREIGAGGPVGWWGLNTGTAIGVPLAAAEPRITAAVLGLFWPDSPLALAKRITIPIEFVLQEDDEHIPRHSGLALFDASASAEKTLHANAGRHEELPRFEADTGVRFLLRHLAR